ncbi:AraC family transcriptional regulator [Actinomadura rupiterrae]|uniref:AraC family transcriptional regulator n=1 Tax=Actinomadura rupiterrae TaxID=559627 RepID=UPI0020A27546|nr:AraC family transcriptional regulator [Actinomadura rupiterrae]MCP2337991.1 AraC-like DNA-binding protein [Actinomadura rupiterrae]
MSARARVPEQADWTRLRQVNGVRLDLLDARFTRHEFAPHTHDEFVVSVPTRGLQRCRYRGAEHAAGPGSVLVLEPGVPHTGRPADPTVVAGYSYRVMYAPVELFGSRLPRFTDAVLDDARLAELLAFLYAALSAGCETLEAETRLEMALRLLIRRHATQPDGQEHVPSSRAAARTTEAVIERLSGQLCSPPSLTALAEELGLSRYQLIRAFRSGTGMAPSEWLAQYRVKRARELLACGNRLDEVAAAVGFTDQPHMTRWFRRIVGITPGTYRTSVQDSGVLLAGSLAGGNQRSVPSP